MSARVSGVAPFVGDTGATSAVVEAECVGGACVAVLEGHARSVKALALSADGTALFTGGNDGAICAWTLSDWRFVGAWEGHTAAVLCLGVAPTGALYTGSQDGQLRCWDGASPGAAATAAVAAHKGALHSLVVGRSGDATFVATGGADALVRVWRPDSPDCPCVWLLRAHTGPVFGLALAGDTLISASHDAAGALWRLTGCPEAPGGPPPPAPVMLRGHDNGLNDAVRVSSDKGTVWTASNDASIRGWATATGTCTAVLTGHTRSVLCLAISADDSALYSGSSDGEVRAWRTADGSANHVMRGHKGAVYTLALAQPGGILFSGAYDDTIRGWATAYGSCVCLLRGHANLVTQLLLAPDDATLFSASADATARVWTVPAAPPLPRVGCAPALPYARGPSAAEEELAAAMGQLGAYVPAFVASPKADRSRLAGDEYGAPTTSPSASVTLKPGRDGRARLQATRPEPPPLPDVYYQQPAQEEYAYVEEAPLPPMHAQVLEPRSWAAAAAAAAPAVPEEVLPVEPEVALYEHPVAEAHLTVEEEAVAQYNDEHYIDVPPPPPPPASGLPAYEAPKAGITQHGGAGLTASLLSSPLKPDRKGGAARHPPLPGSKAAAPTTSEADFATRLHAARISGVPFEMPVSTGEPEPASYVGFTGEDAVAAPPAEDKAVAEGNGDSSNDFAARLHRARSSGAFSGESQ